MDHWEEDRKDMNQPLPGEEKAAQLTSAAQDVGGFFSEPPALDVQAPAPRVEMPRENGDVPAPGQEPAAAAPSFHGVVFPEPVAQSEPVKPAAPEKVKAEPAAPQAPANTVPPQRPAAQNPGVPGAAPVPPQQASGSPQQPFVPRQPAQPYGGPYPGASPYMVPPFGQPPRPYAPGPYGQYQAVKNTASNQKKTKPKSKVGRIFATVGIGLVVLLLGCGITAAVVKGMYEAENYRLHRELENQAVSFQEELDYVDELLKDQAFSFEEQLKDLEKKLNKATVLPSQNGTQVLPEGMLTPAQLYAQCVDSVVAINNQTSDGYGKFTTAGTGSGFILTEDGYVVTNHHVVDGAEKLVVTLSNGLRYEAGLVGSDNINDVALLKIDVGDHALPAVTIGSSADLRIGDQVVAIGNPLGDLTYTATVGYISGKDRPVNTEGTIIDMLQTDAAINAGNSGGPLFNMYGEVVGITTAKYSGTTNSGASIEGIGFAIPIDDVYGMISDYREHGYITGGYLGVEVSSVNPVYAQYHGTPVGAYVKKVTKGSCAEKAGVQVDDVITSLGGYEVENLTDLTRALRNFEAGDKVEISVYRDGETLVLEAVLDEKPKQ